jgi:hypothetical protein
MAIDCGCANGQCPEKLFGKFCELLDTKLQFYASPCNKDQVIANNKILQNIYNALPSLCDIPNYKEIVYFQTSSNSALPSSYNFERKTGCEILGILNYGNGNVGLYYYDGSTFIKIKIPQCSANETNKMCGFICGSAITHGETKFTVTWDSPVTKEYLDAIPECEWQVFQNGQKIRRVNIFPNVGSTVKYGINTATNEVTTYLGSAEPTLTEEPTGTPDLGCLWEFMIPKKIKTHDLVCE